MGDKDDTTGSTNTAEATETTDPTETKTADPPWHGNIVTPRSLEGAIAVTRRVHPPSGRAPGPSTNTSPAQRKRRYPKMRALLRSPEEVPDGTDAPSRVTKEVPGTFFPRSRAPEHPRVREPASASLDNMLACMAEGLLVGSNEDGHTEVRITLRDEFFAGTELRISTASGQVTAVLVPPDRETYWLISGRIDELRTRLAERGLRIAELKVANP